MSKMSAELQYLLQDFLRTEYPELIKGSRFIKQGSGIKFWAIDPRGVSSENIRHRVQLHLQKKHKLDGLVTVIVGVAYRGAPPHITIRMADAKDVRSEPFGDGDFERAPPPEPKTKLTTKVTSLPVPVATLKRWNLALAMLRTEAGRTSLEQVERVEKELDAYIKVANGKL